jgi:D-alanyl-D-alanine carboxypeptidase
MLRSGNDCATALALHCGGSVADFCVKMNDTAQRAGAISTQFKNPHGLPANGHYTTAQDLTAMTCYALQNPKFCQIVSTKYYEPRGWKNKNKLLFAYSACVGVKTGYTKEAGRCLVSAATQDGMTLVCTVLNCVDMYSRSEKLLKDAFAGYEYVKLIDKAQTFALDNTKDMGRVRADIYYPLLPEEKEWISINIVPSIVKKLDEQGEIVGYVEIRLAKRLLFSKNLYKI